MRNNNEIIELIIELKNEKNLSMSELARRTNISKSGLSRYFNKTREFPLNKVNDFAKILGVTPEYILGFEIETPQPKPVHTPSEEDSDLGIELMARGLSDLQRSLIYKIIDLSEDGAREVNTFVDFMITKKEASK